MAPGHMPSEAKIENFIRTKYESKRWVMDGPMPDPSTLEVEGDDDVVSATIYTFRSERKLTLPAIERCPAEGRNREICVSETSCTAAWTCWTISDHSTRPSGGFIR